MEYTFLAIAVSVSLVASCEDTRGGRSARPAQADDALVARVNGEPVSKADFKRMLGNPLTRSQLERELGAKDADPKSLERLAMRKAIHHRLMLQEADRRNLEVTREDLDKAVAALRRRFEDLEGFARWMQDQSLDDKGLYEAIRGDMLAGRVWASISEEVRVTDEQAQEYYDAHKGELVSGEEVRLRIIAVKDEKAADDILASLKKGASFAQLARQRSEGQRAAQGGDTGWVDSRKLQEPLAGAVPKLKPGDVGGPLDNGSGGFLLVGLEARRPILAKTLAEARPDIERRLLPVNREAAVAAWLTEQEKKSKVEILRQK